MTPDHAAQHGAAEDERNRTGREQRIQDKAAADATAAAHALAQSRASTLLPYDTVRYDDGDWGGCTW